MRFSIIHEIKGRMRIHVVQKRMSYEQADTLCYYLNNQECVTSVNVRERTQDVTICYVGNRNTMISALKDFSYEKTEVPEVFLRNSGRKLNDEYWQKLVGKLVLRVGNKLFVPYQIRALLTTVKSVKYICQGIQTLAKRKIEVPVLDGTAIGISILRKDYNTAGSIMFLLGIGEILEEWTHKKSVDDLARSMSLHIEKVWLLKDGQEILTDATSIVPGDRIVAGTYLLGCIGAGGSVFLERAPADDMEAVLLTAGQLGGHVCVVGDGIYVQAPARPLPVRLVTAPHPGFPTDLQSVAMAVATKGSGTT